MGPITAKALGSSRFRLQKTLIVALVLAAAIPVFANPAEIVRAIQATSNLEAKFVQRFTPKGFRNEQVERGMVLFGDLPEMRWTYDSPEDKIFVFDGFTSWFYVPEDQQVTVHDLSREERDELPFVLLGDEEAVTANYRVSPRQNDRGRLLVLDPVTSGAMLRSIEIEVDPRQGWIRRLSYEDREGNKTVFEVTGQKRVDPGEGAFRFDPPAGVDIIGNKERK